MNPKSPIDLTLFKRLLQNLLNITVLQYDNNDTMLNEFEGQYCLYPALQPMYQASSLKDLTSRLEDHTIYEITDDLGICLTLFRFSGSVFLLGPYVKNVFKESATEMLLIRHHLAASLLLSIKMNYAKLPLLNAYYVQETIKACIFSFEPDTPVYTSRQYQEKNSASNASDASTPLRSLHTSADEIAQGQAALQNTYHRYALEDEYLSMVRRGDVRSLSGILSQIFRGEYPKKFSEADFTSVYQNPLSIIRSLARRAAAESGLSVITIDYITQKNVQKMASARTLEEMQRYTIEVVEELTQAVQRHLYQADRYSPLVNRAMEYLSMNYAQPITGPQLCHDLGVSSSHLSRVFKEETGMTITQAISMLRCRHAAELLENSDLSIQDISNYVGYLDNNYFCKVFRRQYGMTPSEYQQSRK